ncbi:MAG: heme-binding protein [Reichenbachiella sp.]
MKLKKGIQVINTVIHECIRSKKDAIVAVVDQNGELVSFARTDNAPLSHINVAINKAYTAVRLRKETEQFDKELDKMDPEDIENFDDLKLVSWPGGIPIYEEEKLIGGIGISGLDAHEDVALAKLAAKAIKPKPPVDDNTLKLYS